jgi:hypothetical protein
MAIFQSHTGKKLLFVHIPKTGGQTLMYLFGHHDFSTRPRPDILLGVDSTSKIELSHLTLGEILSVRPEILDQIHQAFTIIRHPFSRIISSYLFLSKDHYYRIIGRNHDLSFDDFIEKCKQILQQQDQYSQVQICHYRRMSDFVLIDDKIPDYLKILRYENYENQVREFLSEENSPTSEPLKELPTINKSRGTKKNLLNKKNAKMICEIYERDFELFGYDPNIDKYLGGMSL